MRFASVGIALALAFAACSITHKSGDYACDTSAECAPGRLCSGGYCVTSTLPVDAAADPIDANDPDRIDAGQPSPDAPVTELCPAQCTSCEVDDRQCTIACGPANNNCNAPVVCPTGWSCEVACGTSDSCRAGVNCLGSTACHVTCSGSGSCGNIACGAGPCDVECSGFNSCERNIRCGMACECDVTCTGAGIRNCQTDILCGDIACDTFDGGCTSTPTLPGQQCSTACM